MGLVNAAVHFCSENGTKFTAYARAWIELELQRSVSSHVQLDNSTRTKAFEDLLPRLGSLNEANDSWDVPLHAYRVHEVETDVSFTSDVNPESQLEPSDSRWERNNQSAASWITMDTEPTASIEKKEFDALLDEGLQKALEVLNSREQRIVEVLWLRTDDNTRHAVRDLAAEFGLGKGRIRQIEAEAFRKMRNCFLTLYPQLRRA
jgi:RNA polymerase sigma-32 factor